MTIAEALKFAEEMQSKLSYRLECAQNVPARSYYEKQDEMLIRAIAALREQEKRENPQPITIDELRQMDGQPVWVVPLDPEHANTAWEEYCVLDGDEADAPGIEYWAWSLKEYGETWIAYRHKPEKVQK